MTFLYKCRITIYNDSYNLNCVGTNGKNRTIVFRGSEKGFKLFLKRIKATDQTTQPRTKKALTYQNMINSAKDGNDPYIYVYSHMLPKQDIIKENSEIKSKINKVILELESLLSDYRSDKKATQGMKSKEKQRFRGKFDDNKFQIWMQQVGSLLRFLVTKSLISKNSIKSYNSLFKSSYTLEGDYEGELLSTIKFIKDLRIKEQKRESFFNSNKTAKEYLSES